MTPLRQRGSLVPCTFNETSFNTLDVDISELNLPKTCSISFPNGKDDLMNFEVTIRPDEGYYL